MGIVVYSVAMLIFSLFPYIFGYAVSPIFYISTDTSRRSYEFGFTVVFVGQLCEIISGVGIVSWVVIILAIYLNRAGLSFVPSDYLPKK